MILRVFGVSERESPGVGVRFRIFFGHLLDLGQLTSHLWGLYSDISLTGFYIKWQVGGCFEISSGAVGEGGITIYSFPWNLSEKQAFHHPHSSESLCLGLWPQQKGFWQAFAPGHCISALISFESVHFSLSPLLLPWSKHSLLLFVVYCCGLLASPYLQCPRLLQTACLPQSSPGRTSEIQF